MCISIEEFWVGMEVYDERRVGEAQRSKYQITVPRFNVQGIDFIH